MNLAGLVFARRVQGDKGILVAVIDWPKDLPLKSEHQYEFSMALHERGFTMATTGATIDQTDVARGNSIDGILREPIWRTG